MEVKELLEQIKANKDNKELQEGLKGLNLFEVREVQKDYTDKEVMAYLKEHNNLSEKIYNANCIKFLSKKLGKTEEELNKDSAVLGADIVFKKDLSTQAEKYNSKLKDMAINQLLGDKAELLSPHVKRENIKIDDNFNFTGLDEEVNNLKNKFPSLFEEKQVEKNQVPGGTGLPSGDPVKNPWAKDSWNMDKQAELFRENRDLAIKYMKQWENQK